MMESHMTFSIGKGSENLYLNIVDLVIVFLMSMVVEWMSHTTYMSNFSDHHNFRVGLIQTGLYAVRMTVAYAVMSFDAGILSAAVAGYSLGFLVFGSRVFHDEFGYQKPSDLPPLNC
ncbi:hypothetical protein C2S51_023577 [Perilla frutescens var. frutescens]|nr:hypothetical protein C2S51_023577 [Perilla frutescens var. frutescens]